MNEFTRDGELHQLFHLFFDIVQQTFSCIFQYKQHNNMI